MYHAALNTSSTIRPIIFNSKTKFLNLFSSGFYYAKYLLLNPKSDPAMPDRSFLLNYMLCPSHDSSCISVFSVYPQSSVPIYLRSSPLLMSDTLDITVPQKFTRT